MSEQRFCPYCSQVRRVVWVHGHGQCEACHINIDECCRGETLTEFCPQKPGSPG